MSYQKVLSLANKFAQDIQDESFSHRYRALLNEMEGDYMALRIKGLDRSNLHELGKLYHNLFEIFKSSPNSSAMIATLSRFVSQNAESISKLNSIIQQFLKDSQIEFISGPGLKQAEVHSIKKLFNLSKTTLPSMMVQPSEQLLNIKEEYKPFAGPGDKTNPAIPAVKSK
jgi:hypothetical protein